MFQENAPAISSTINLKNLNTGEFILYETHKLAISEAVIEGIIHIKMP